MAKSVSKIDELRGIVKSYEARISRARHVQKNDEYYTTNKNRLVKQIESLQAQLDTLEYERHFADDIVDECVEKIEATQRKIQKVKDPAIQKMMEYAKKLKALQAANPDIDLTKLVAVPE